MHTLTKRYRCLQLCNSIHPNSSLAKQWVFKTCRGASQQLRAKQEQQQLLLEPEAAGTYYATMKDLARKGKSRLDTYISALLPDVSRAKISASIKAGLITVNGTPITKPSHSVKGGDSIAVALLPPEPSMAVPEAVPLDVVYEDDHIIVINKPAGMVVHPSPGRATGTLVNALLAHCGLSALSASDLASGNTSASSAAGGGLLSSLAAMDWDAETDDGDINSTDDDGDDKEACGATAVSAQAGGAKGWVAASREANQGHVGVSGYRQTLRSIGDGIQAASQQSAGKDSWQSSNSNSTPMNGIIRPGIVHRLDRGTSGLMVVAKTDYAHAHLCQQFKARTVSRIYSSITTGDPLPPAARVATNITRDPGNRLRMMAVPYGSGRGRTAASNYQVLEVLAAGGAALVQWKLETGRTHQIRVHAKHLGHPLLGDNMYGPGHAASAQRVIGKRSSLLSAARAAIEGFNRPALHARTLGVTHPVSGNRLEFDSLLPEDFLHLYHQLKEWS